MAIKIYEQFAPFANPADGDYPYGSIKNDSIPGAEDGTPLDAVWANDYAGTDAELFAQAGIVPNGQPDKLGASQRVDAITKICGRVFANVAAMVAFNGFQDGQSVKTLGYYGVGGGWDYEIVTTSTYGGVPDGITDFYVQGGQYVARRVSVAGFIPSSTQDAPTYTQNPQFNISNPESIASWNSGGKAILPNYIGHNVEIKRFTGSLPSVFEVPVTFNVTPQTNRNVVFTAQKNGFLKVFLSSELTVTGYGTDTISIEPLASEMVGVTEVDVWVIGDYDQHITGDTGQQNLQHNFGGYDNITNRQQSYNLGAHNVIDGTGDHQTIWGATYSIIDSGGSYNAIVGGTNNQVSGASSSSVAMGEGTRLYGGRSLIGGFNCRDNKTGCAQNIVWGRDIKLGSNSQYNAVFGFDTSTSNGGSYNLVTGENCNALESYAAIGGKGSQARSYSVAHGENMLVSASHSYGFGFNGLSTKKYSGMSGYQPVVRNTGSIVHGASKSAQGDDQFFSLQLRNAVASGIGTWTKLLTLDDVNKVVLDGSSLASITARIGVKSNDGTSFADIEVKAFYTNSGALGVIGSTTTVLHSIGGNAGTIDARIIEISAGSFSFSVEVTTGNASFGAVASAKVDVMEFV